MNKLIRISDIQKRIYELRGQKVILDKDIANIYGIDNRQLKRQVRRNIERFPSDFMFILSNEEIDGMVCQIGTPLRSTFGGSKPYAFTRNGVNMLAAVLRSKIAIQRSIFIMRAFSALEEAVGMKKQELLRSPKVIKQLSVHSRAIMKLFKETEINRKDISLTRKLQDEMIELIQKIIIASIAHE
jgi:hypothetical protein